MHRSIMTVAGAMLLPLMVATPASAQLILNQVIVDLFADKPRRMDIEASNTGHDRLYVVAEPSEILDAGKPTENRVTNPDPGLLGLLATPQKMILEPGEHKLVRIASIVPPSTAERIYRVTIKPVAGDVSAASSTLKILVGYDVLVVVRPSSMTGTVTGFRQGHNLVLSNTGSTNVESMAANSATSGPTHARRCQPGDYTLAQASKSRSIQRGRSSTKLRPDSPLRCSGSNPLPRIW